MDQPEDTEEGAPPPKTALCEDHEAPRRSHQQRPNSARPGPEPSFVSIRSDRSVGIPLNFKQDQRPYSARTGPEPVPSSVSMRSDRSVGIPLNFKQDQRPYSARTGPEPVPSFVSMRSDRSVGIPLNFKQDQRPDSARTGPEPVPSCVSMRSDRSVGIPLNFKQDQRPDSARTGPEPVPSCVSMRSDRSVGIPLNFRQDQRLDSARTGPEPRRSQKPDCAGPEPELSCASMKSDRSMGPPMPSLRSRTRAATCGHELKSNLKKKFQCLFEGVTKAGRPNPLNQIFTELFITEGGAGEVNEEHEVRQIETASWKSNSPETPIRVEHLFKASPGRSGPIRRVMTTGVAGIGKTVLTQKFTLDWAEDQTNQDIHFTFPFTFRALNLLKEQKFSLVELVHHFFTETKEAGICRFEEFQVIFILDGLDECRIPLDFTKTKILTDVTESTSVQVLLTNLIRGNLLPSAHLWITTRPAAADQVPPDCVDLVTEVRGFTDSQKQEYFRKQFRAEEKVTRIISCIQTSRSLHIMCHIPVFCWITSTVLEDMLKTREGDDLPTTLTEMYIHFLVINLKMKRVKYDEGVEADEHWSPENLEMIRSLGKLAFEQLHKGNLIFYESDLRECGFDIRAASVYSGVFTQIFKEERGLYWEKVFCFIHLSVQEFLAALHVHLTFITSGVNLMSEEPSTSWRSKLFRDKTKLIHLHQSAVDQALLSPNGHLDLFLRFLLGLSLENNQKLLLGLLRQTGSSSQTSQTSEYIKKKINDDLSAERSINLFHCLNELNDGSLVEDIQQSLRSGLLSSDNLSPAQWSALVFILLSSGEDLEEFDLKKYSASEEALLRLLPVVKVSNKVLLSDCNLSERSCEALSSVLSSQSSSLRHLDLSHNDLKDSGVMKLCPGLESPRCSLETLRMSFCNLSERSCEALSSVLSSPSSSLRHLDLSTNDLGDLGVMKLHPGLESPHCSLETLRLAGCLVSEEGCASLASALKSKPPHLRELDLSYNHPGDSAEKVLSEGQQSPDWRLDTLRLDHGGEQRFRPGLRKYSCELELDPNTVNRKLKLSEDLRTVIGVSEDQSYPDHPDRFDVYPQVLCRTGLSGVWFWEVQWRGTVLISVSYRGIRRIGDSSDCLFGSNDQSWSLFCSDRRGYSVFHNNRGTPMSSSSDSDRVSVFVDCPAGTLSFYRVSSDSLIHLHTFRTTFTGPVYPGFGLYSGSSVSVCSS